MDEIRKLTAVALVSSVRSADGMCYLTFKDRTIQIVQANGNIISELSYIYKIHTNVTLVEPAPQVSPKTLRLMKDFALNASCNDVCITVYHSYPYNNCYIQFNFASDGTHCYARYRGLTGKTSLQLDFDATRNTLMNFIAKNPDLAVKN